MRKQITCFGYSKEYYKYVSYLEIVSTIHIQSWIKRGSVDTNLEYALKDVIHPLLGMLRASI